MLVSGDRIWRHVTGNPGWQLLLFANTDYVKANPGILPRLVKLYQDFGEFLNNNPDEADDIVSSNKYVSKNVPKGTISSAVKAKRLVIDVRPSWDPSVNAQIWQMMQVGLESAICRPCPRRKRSWAPTRPNDAGLIDSGLRRHDNGNERHGRTREHPQPRSGRTGCLASCCGLTAVIVFIVGWHLASYVAPTCHPQLGAHYPRPGAGFLLRRARHHRTAAVFHGAVVRRGGRAFDAGFREAEPRGLLMPDVRLLMAVPAACWVVFSILWFKPVELPHFFRDVHRSCIPVFFVDCLDAMKAIPLELRQMVESFLAQPPAVLRQGDTPRHRPEYADQLEDQPLTGGACDRHRRAGRRQRDRPRPGAGAGDVLRRRGICLDGVLVIILFMFQGLMNLVEKRALKPANGLRTRRAWPA